MIRPAEKQKTIAREGSLEGIGLHSGEPSKVFFKPAGPDTGIRFSKKGTFIAALTRESDFVFPDTSVRCSYVGDGESRILTVEHLLAALQGMGISNLSVDVHGPEIPGLDGSALPFVRLFKELGVIEQDRPKDVYKVTEPIFCYDETRAICIYPADEFSVAYILDYEHPYLRNQKADFRLAPDIFEKEIAPARTFCTEKEAEELPKHGLGRGADRGNTVVVTQDGSHQKTMRFQDECARHKVLDILGDLNLLGFPVMGRVVGLRSGHSLNRKLVHEIKRQRGLMNIKKETKDAGLLMGPEKIKSVLPHRYPFLLVDRVLEMNEKSIVCVKNVSANEPFFQGHFPQKPVMPGVLIVEALAQAGGILMLAKSEFTGKIAYLVAINKARFRKMVIPGDQLRLEVEVLKFKSRVGIVKGVAFVEGQEVCDAEIMFSLGD